MTAEERQAGMAFDQFVREQRAPLAGFLRHRVATEDEAQEVAQESFVRLIRYRDEPPESWPALLYRIAVNVMTDRARRAQSHHAAHHVDVDIYAEAIAAPGPDPGQALDTLRALEEVQRALLCLPSRCRDIYLLNRIEGMSYTEVAVHCGISVKAVEKHIGKALGLLRKQVGHHLSSVVSQA
ncbi:sigma-70 family RNA polymerase sigma factor [Luteibacter sp. ME-Dv--P-043b]|uniref:RNA polymerase sigma factor n=1 Tax=unclassified Luteibacter TaxID=2620188 RepID=UPI00255635A8|nr:sigma-70 family RNA polymerase sigma factor [Luteibacter sp. ME-Dv--P-043b]